MSRPSAVESDACVANQRPSSSQRRLVNYQETILDIHSQLASRDVEALKFLLVDVVPLGRLERFKNALHLFEELQNLCLIGPPDDVEFLAELLWYIGRYDLLKKLKYSPREVEQDLISDVQLNHLAPYR